MIDELKDPWLCLYRAVDEDDFIWLRSNTTLRRMLGDPPAGEWISLYRSVDDLSFLKANTLLWEDTDPPADPWGCLYLSVDEYDFRWMRSNTILRRMLGAPPKGLGINKEKLCDSCTETLT